MTNERLQKGLLLVAATGLIPIALSYGLIPEKSLNFLYGFSEDNINLTHIMRAVMGLYFGQIIIWFLGVFKSELRRPAMYCLVLFMLGLAGGRMFSLLLDGTPHFLLLIYLFLELSFGLVGLILIIKERK